MRFSQLRPRLQLSLSYQAYLNQRKPELEAARKRCLRSRVSPPAIPLVNEDDRESLFTPQPEVFLKPSTRSPR